jgi:anaerobic selenocysteine-containing dehydrogenase
VRLALCGCEAVVENGRLMAIEPDPSHPTGKALCAKGRASPELVAAPDRLLYPVRHTRPKGDSDPGWQRISWDEALDETAAAVKGGGDLISMKFPCPAEPGTDGSNPRLSTGESVFAVSSSKREERRELRLPPSSLCRLGSLLPRPRPPARRPAPAARSISSTARI